jgi:hypothetical protein
LQIDRVISERPDIVIVGCTTQDRIELPIRIKRFEEIADLFKWSTWTQSCNQTYIKSRGLGNVKYHPHPDLSSDDPSLQDPTILSESINNLAFLKNNYQHYKDEMPAPRSAALRTYLLELYDDSIKRQYDCWIISNALRKLYDSKIPFLIVAYPLFESEWTEDLAWLDDGYKITKEQFDYYALEPGPARFHTSEAAAGEFANYIEYRLKQKGLL